MVVDPCGAESAIASTGCGRGGRGPSAEVQGWAQATPNVAASRALILLIRLASKGLFTNTTSDNRSFIC